MDIVNISNAKEQLSSLIETVNKTHQPIKILCDDGKSAILVGYDDWLTLSTDKTAQEYE